MAYEAPYCKLCGSKHPLGQHTAFGTKLERAENRNSPAPRTKSPTQSSVGDVTAVSSKRRGDIEPNNKPAARPSSAQGDTNKKDGAVKDTTKTKKKKRAKSGTVIVKVKLGRPTEEMRKAKQTLTAQKPWKSEGLSRSQWYKKRAKKKRAKSRRSTGQ